QLTVKSLLDPARWGANRLYTALCQAGFAGGRVPAAVLRLALIGTPFSQPMSFGVDVLVQARAGVERLQSLWSRLQEASDGGAPSSELRSVVTLATRQLDAALDDQLNTSQALAATFGAVGAANQRRLSSGDARLLRGFLDRVDHVFGALTHDAQSGSLSHAELAQQVSQLAPLASPDPAAIGEWLVARFAARRAGDYARADAIRDALAARGFELEDTREGVRWRSR
ncbi:MAG: DALR domain-containing protein, partial [Polyangiales bacterium]